MSKPVVQCSGIWKIFGNKANEALQAIREQGLSKSDVLKRYGAVTAVADVSFSVGEGEIFCIMGLSGSGKSTLIRHINRLVEPTDGEIVVAGRNVGALSNSDLRALRSTSVGMVFQNMALLPHRSVQDNVALSLELRGVSKVQRIQTAKEKLELVGLEEWASRFPDELSGGMKQRVGLARAMAADPEILLMDEPFSALDPLIRRQLQQQFLELSKVVKKTTIFITHDLDEAIRLGTHIAIMKDGRFVQVGTPEEIITDPADEYVADFVKGISRLELVTARKIMKPIPNDAVMTPHNGATVAATDKIGAIIDLATHHDGDITVMDDNRPVGTISRRDLLLGIRG
ncbi:quaternary amine ABC transporter ATP-binding protein [Mesorhizobium loti]|uniref:Quaternary amine transport ATP-binding protein n=1 Tax=Rhizobium loti TaxID=381 RepID=A0A1A5IF69_RHILI|nr:betaine/proline/choline family ABC transporter ATP-binding protein [Mesorhizobium loti]OBP77883.1 glycine/betaine ABC transporter [Mesorhizobium loti]OBQ69837.1 glycine/betaine ABC transporter [Mesorhizobium loti]QKC73220.1 ATP-binding cassette domain-containing protein [Mesorhizobium loti]